MNAVLNKPEDAEELVMSVDARGRLVVDANALKSSGPMARQYAAAKRLKLALLAKRRKKSAAPTAG